jgi:Mn2+/Fe2+ NRAMP family transporter
LFWTAVIDGLLAPFLLAAVLYVATDRKIMHQQPSSIASVIAVGITTLAMFFAGFAMIWFG